jgi:DNA-binding response OmpR family regulator
MPGGNGLDVVSALKAKRPSPMVIMLTVGPRSEYQTLSYLMGADYFLEKSSDLRRMLALLKSKAASFGRTSAMNHPQGGTQ